MRALVEYHDDDAHARLAFGLPADVWRLVHFIIFDHDGDTPDKPGKDSHRLEDACTRAGMSDHSYRLHRRGQEHYIPIEALKEIANSRANPTDLAGLLAAIETHERKDAERHFSLLPVTGQKPFFKNEFANSAASTWDDTWFEQDGAWPEMTQLAERIASAI